METDEAKEVRGPQRQGTLLQGRYEITAVQEEFAHAVFYAAFDHSLSQRVCIKTAAGASQPRPAQEWLWEAKVQMRLDHRAIPHCLNYFEDAPERSARAGAAGHGTDPWHGAAADGCAGLHP